MLADPAAAGTELALLARRGDAGALGELLARHRAGMMAVALSMLPRADEAEDVVQDAALIALARIGELRDPGAAGPWLRAIVRNCCRMRMRARTAVPVELREVASGLGDQDALLERRALRDWVAHAIGELSLPLRTVALLRYFSPVTAYEDIAALCGVPSGTVRRRLHEARRLLAGKLSGARDGYADGAADMSRHWAEARQAATAGREGTFEAYLRDGWHPEVTGAWSTGRRTRGIAPLGEVMDRNVSAGMRPYVAGVSATRELAVWEIEVRSDEDTERTCSRYAYWLLSSQRGRVKDLRVFSAG
jgi:RNA polymerase sigma-70 factor, ECF subfamily